MRLHFSKPQCNVKLLWLSQNGVVAKRCRIIAARMSPRAEARAALRGLLSSRYAVAVGELDCLVLRCPGLLARTHMLMC